MKLDFSTAVCPSCKNRLNKLSETIFPEGYVELDSPPKPGDFCICWYCGSLNCVIIDDSGLAVFRRAYANELISIGPDAANLIVLACLSRQPNTEKS